MQKCYEIKNFNTLFTIMTALTSSAIRRMGLTWEVRRCMTSVSKQLAVCAGSAYEDESTIRTIEPIHIQC